ncbi:hypothetical protein [Endozoicomonas sp. 4G]|uniref:hypothetical protein n=1 Tax=Endozoicomonas sp. 4G TaxID=2872754 RepID=UPI002078B064|nr:hypothetical protein [Endozoicomonas sp. 4G]
MSRSYATRALFRLIFFMFVFFAQFSTAGAFSKAIMEKNFTAVKVLLDRGHNLQKDSEAVSDALQSRSLEMLLYILNHGADPNSIVHTNTYNMAVNHVLSDAITIYEIVALLSFGADPYADNEWEVTHASADQRWLHLVVYFYYYWGELLDRTTFKAPRDTSELTAIVWLFPVLFIHSLVVLMDNHVDSKDVLSILPEGLKSLYQHSCGHDIGDKRFVR